MYAIRAEALPSFVLILMGTIDCLTTVVGIVYFGAAEINPLLSGVVHTNIFAFMVIKLVATICIAGTYALAKWVLTLADDKTTKSFRFGKLFVKSAYVGLVIFLAVVISNNFIVLFL